MISIARAVAVAAALALAGCSQGGEQSESHDMATPDIAPNSAPGVAFRYGYDFRLADERIDEVQEAHAAGCERLGAGRCRITGMRYTIDPQEQVQGMLQVKLDPAIARQFGKQAVSSAEGLGGQLVSAEFVGEDEGSAIQQATAEQRELRTQIQDLEQRLAGAGTNDRERTQLQQQLQELRGRVAGTRSSIAVSQERLAATPMTFNYYGKGGVPGFRGKNPVEGAWRTFLESGATMISTLLYLLGALLPWAILLLVLALLFRGRLGPAVRGWWRRNSYSSEQVES